MRTLLSNFDWIAATPIVTLNRQQGFIGALDPLWTGQSRVMRTHIWRPRSYLRQAHSCGQGVGSVLIVRTIRRNRKLHANTAQQWPSTLNWADQGMLQASAK